MRIGDFTESRETANAARRLVSLVRQNMVPADAVRGEWALDYAMPRHRMRDAAERVEDFAFAVAPASLFAGVFGAGIGSDHGGDFPVLVVDESAVEIESGEAPMKLSESSLRGVMRELVDGDLPAATKVIAVGEPQPYFGPGTLAKSGAKKGTFGALVTSSIGNKGILTAGHVSRGVGMDVRDGSGNLVGDIEFAEEPSGKGPNAPSADIAVVRIARAAIENENPGVKITATARGTSNDSVVVHGAKSPGESSERMIAFLEFLFVKSLGGEWGSVFMTANDISDPGDSGGPVLNAETGALLGHVVGGEEGRTTYFQAIDFQLKACGATLRS